jgi:hypothetical protein
MIDGTDRAFRGFNHRDRVLANDSPQTSSRSLKRGTKSAFRCNEMQRVARRLLTQD